MGAAKANNSKDTYLATAVTFMVIGALFLIDKLIHFSSIGLPWVMNKDNMLLYAAACFLIRSCVAGTLAGDEYRFGDVIAWFIVRLFVAIDIAYHRYNLILVCKTLKKR